MLPSLAISLYDQAPDSSGLAMAATLCILGGAATAGLTRNHRGNLGLRDAFKVVTLAWFLAGALGALPYFLAAEMVPEIAKYLKGNIEIIIDIFQHFRFFRFPPTF